MLRVCWRSITKSTPNLQLVSGTGRRIVLQSPEFLESTFHVPRPTQTPPSPHPSPRTTSPRSNHVPRNTVFSGAPAARISRLSSGKQYPCLGNKFQSIKMNTRIIVNYRKLASLDLLKQICFLVGSHLFYDTFSC